ncbi:MAG: hypothetical protein QM664_07010 [Flavihumibacter sp.]
MVACFKDKLPCRYGKKQGCSGLGHQYALALKPLFSKGFDVLLGALQSGKTAKFVLQSQKSRSKFVSASEKRNSPPFQLPVAFPSDWFSIAFAVTVASANFFIRIPDTQKLKIMKTVNTQIKRVVTLGVLALVLVLNAGIAKANNERKSAGHKQIELRYVGSVNQMPVLELAFDNEAGENLNVTLRDIDGNVLYTGNFSDKKIVKRFQFDNAVNEDIKIKLTVASGRKIQSETFQINRSSEVVESVTIAKL